jgi:hypothetical protein
MGGILGGNQNGTIIVTHSAMIHGRNSATESSRPTMVERSLNYVSESEMLAVHQGAKQFCLL